MRRETKERQTINKPTSNTTYEMKKWRIEDSEDLYNINGWGASYFSINEKGHVAVTPKKDSVKVDLKERSEEHTSELQSL